MVVKSITAREGGLEIPDNPDRYATPEAMRHFTTTSTFIKNMETKNLWPQMWQVLYEHGASERKREDTERYWNSLTSEQQREVFSSISTK